MSKTNAGRGMLALATTALTCTLVFNGDAQVPPASPSASTSAAKTPAHVQNEEIVVTAQKRSERLNKVPLTVTAASRVTLSNLGITDTRDLGKLVAGFTFTQTALATPVYTLRGVGFYDSALGATPAVTVYVDQIPLTYPQMTRNAAFDLERVEVLKGPQGTLFGQNSTGGAVNYIAAKPTTDFQAGIEATAGNYGTANVNAFISGPITNNLDARLAVEHDNQGDWQKSYTSDATRGQIDLTKSRFLMDYHPDGPFHAEFSASGWLDKSDTPGAQLIAKTSALPPVAAFADYPLAPDNARAADWTPGFPKARDDGFYNVSLRADYEVNQVVNLTSLTSYAHLSTDDPVDADGTALDIDNSIERGDVGTFNQEVRGAINLPTTRIIVGGNFSKDIISEFQNDNVLQSSNGTNTSVPGFPVNYIDAVSSESRRTAAGFANLEQHFGDRLTVQGGVRYTDDLLNYSTCAQDVGGPLAASLGFLANYILRPALHLPGTTVIPPNSCATLNSNLQPGPVVGTLHQNNVSWRIGPSYKLTASTLVYLNISKGYKSGTVPTIFGVAADEYVPTTQESVMAYEAGVKSGLLGNRLQVNAAAYHYDYTNKQILGTIIDPLFGPLQRLVNIPKSTINGAELEVTASPITGLSIAGSATYVQSAVTSSFENFNAYGTPINFQGYAFPYTPKWTANLNAQYTFPVSERYNMFFGGNLSYSSKTTSFFGANVPYDASEPQHANPQGQHPDLPNSYGGLDIDSRALLDLRAGIETANGHIRFTLWGRNVTNKYYWTNATYYPSDPTIRYAGMPATYGATLSYRFGGR